MKVPDEKSVALTASVGTKLTPSIAQWVLETLKQNKGLDKSVVFSELIEYSNSYAEIQPDNINVRLPNFHGNMTRRHYFLVGIRRILSSSSVIAK